MTVFNCETRRGVVDNDYIQYQTQWLGVYRFSIRHTAFPQPHVAKASGDDEESRGMFGDYSAD